MLSTDGFPWLHKMGLVYWFQAGCSVCWKVTGRGEMWLWDRARAELPGRRVCWACAIGNSQRRKMPAVNGFYWVKLAWLSIPPLQVNKTNPGSGLICATDFSTKWKQIWKPQPCPPPLTQPCGLMCQWRFNSKTWVFPLVLNILCAEKWQQPGWEKHLAPQFCSPRAQPGIPKHLKHLYVPVSAGYIQLSVQCLTEINLLQNLLERLDLW